ncbi:hypothetical protein HZR89_16135 [Klebsiella pneumoniae]|uniref:hypothetical protein n=1 Tax=Klebsiella pneumoniae TaxID=573 RepID=UPI000E2CC21D|nr:hypothetical protein [Klebsiella pneumoniae]MBC6346314.1 hypothetical protein [Klebsiella pneumoniae]MDE8909058.1 hypothetical protein [Klebsiella pneumoniae]MDE8992582.1 hypothetical protein [Klebsiella pneumoniae]SYF85677.1 2-aminoethylphosphonate transporter, membrane component [Klebsiella pneumoniae]SYG49313.1 2-aminoethylphosphonate transporter, membrane component [Klebsiella pneumoniae]
MLIWSRKGRAAAGALAVTLFAGVFLLPLAVILLSSLSKQWNGLLPTGFTFAHFVNAFRGAAWDSLFSSLMVGFCASLLALLCGMWAALALSLSLSMGELGATVMMYPPGWTTLPVTIFSLTDRGNIADGSALTIVLVGVTLLLMMKLERIARRLSQR